MNTLVFENITKKYGKKMALDNCTACFSTGINALLGPNGAGKSTMMNIIADLISYHDGKVLWNGENVKKQKKEFRSILGFMPQNISLYKSFTVADNLRYFGILKGMDKEKVENIIPQLLEKVNLSDCADKKFGSLSGGMQRRVGIAVAIMNEPQLLILDEPTAGLDPKERIHFRNIINDMSKRTVIILSTHIVSDVEQLADNIIMLKNGHVCESGTVAYLEEKYAESSVGKSPLESVYMNFFGGES